MTCTPSLLDLRTSTTQLAFQFCTLQAHHLTREEVATSTFKHQACKLLRLAHVSTSFSCQHDPRLLSSKHLSVKTLHADSKHVESNGSLSYLVTTLAAIVVDSTRSCGCLWLRCLRCFLDAFPADSLRLKPMVTSKDRTGACS